MRARVDDKVCPVTPRDQLVRTLESTGCDFFRCCCFCCAVCSEVILRMFQHFDSKLNYALNHHHFYSLQENQSVQGKCCRHTNKETSICLQQLHRPLPLCWSCALNSRSKRCRLLKPLLLSMCWEFRAGLCLTLLRLISRLKPLIVFLYHLDNYHCSKITAQQTVKLYLW